MREITKTLVDILGAYGISGHTVMPEAIAALAAIEAAMRDEYAGIPMEDRQSEPANQLDEALRVVKEAQEQLADVRILLVVIDKYGQGHDQDD